MNLNINNDISTTIQKTYVGTRVVEIVYVTEQKELFPLNPTTDGLCKTIKGQYYKNSLANFIHEDGRSATGVIEIMYDE